MYLVQSFRIKGSGNCCEELYLFFRLRDHVVGPDNNPLLIFPEGTCVNNHYTVMFKKDIYVLNLFLLRSSWSLSFDLTFSFICLYVEGAFELGCSVFPVAIKYNKIFVDAFWNSRK
ncbi:putative glycerol-3-phosphate 1-O-acyltransferase [Rosa chinensis]|uniref:Putative glycerol-3-phosphate 1-O-acyltransferase n=1 Tax=Rosa chinensis TaxID=74649 RepID=A0A2P6QWD8_ROSCH|nr:putative glycerol-3-phosphate 1-O-acyltransferase [Rosa chinensis]